jgi:hypothetical protein
MISSLYQITVTAAAQSSFTGNFSYTCRIAVEGENATKTLEILEKGIEDFGQSVFNPEKEPFFKAYVKFSSRVETLFAISI